MKKIFLLFVGLTFVLSCSTDGGMKEHHHEMAMEAHHHDHDHNHNHGMMMKKEHNHSHDVDINDFKGEVFNYHNKKEFKHSHILFILDEDGDEAFIRIDGEEYELDLEKSASGSLYKSEDGKISFHIKGKEASLEMNGEVIDYFLLKGKSRDYAKGHHHDHDHDHK